LTVTSCTTFPAQITRGPATKVINSSPGKEQVLN
jgi:hypothetical protein